MEEVRVSIDHRGVVPHGEPAVLHGSQDVSVVVPGHCGHHGACEMRGIGRYWESVMDHELGVDNGPGVMDRMSQQQK